MTKDDHAISLLDFYAEQLADLQARMDASRYHLTLDTLYKHLQAGDVEKFERALAFRYVQIVYAVLAGEPTCDASAVEAQNRLLGKLESGEISWDAVDFRNDPLDLDDNKGETQ